MSSKQKQIIRAIKKCSEAHDYVLCPHTACGVAAAEDYSQREQLDLPIVCLATAHPAKFGDAVQQVCAYMPRYC